MSCLSMGQEETVGDDWGCLREEGSSKEPTQEGTWQVGFRDRQGGGREG